MLICPLEWGLGHVTRCIPLIEIFRKEGYDVSVAVGTGYHTLIKTYFPDIRFFRLPSLKIRFWHNNVFAGLVFWLPGFLLLVFREHLALAGIIRRYGIDIVVSDNRYGLWSKKVSTVLITHQLFIQIPGALSFFRRFVWSVTHFFIARFDKCWIPDFAEKRVSLSGDLSHGGNIPSNALYTGPLSRFKRINKRNPSSIKEYPELLVILSGPEPHRTILETTITREVTRLSMQTVIFRGILSEMKNPADNEYVRYIGFPDDNEFVNLVHHAGAIICRAGYSTIMDLAMLGRTALLIPTPGQTEQEYLAEWLANTNRFASMAQDEFDLEKGLILLNSRKNSVVIPGQKHFDIKTMIAGFNTSARLGRKQ